ncbi:hypothetical protein CYY_003507 [Polysphondylium violaceum]|uniref:THH1/TOM1/TOM3 domain-containing protein n=1 Tax=Polysphondylium violaceum TaxID=133409 RepID=A0A8J4PWR3_9MYCE|nr:hypothetical protein CYY_003507 [Polysphondylium violaceum]
MVKTTINTQFVLLISFILSFLFLKSYGFELKSSSITEKTTNVLGAELNYALMDLEFDRDIYKIISVDCANYNCNIDTSVPDCSCDYTDPLECPKAASPGCPECPTDITIPYGEQNLTLYYCFNPDGASQDWITINANEPINIKRDTKDPIHIRYKAKGKECEGIKVLATPNQGIFYINWSPLPYDENLGRFSGISNKKIYVQMSICPTDNTEWALAPSWTSDTYFLTIFPDTPFIDLNVTINSHPVPPYTPPTIGCQNVLPTHQCINDGELVTGEGEAEQLKYFTYLVTEPKVLAFSFPSLAQDIDFFISDDPKYPEPTSTSNPKYDMESENDDYLVLSARPYPDGSPKVLYIGVSAFYTSNFSFVITSQGHNIYHRVADDFPLGGAYSILSSSRLFLSNGDIYSCYSWARCLSYVTLYPYSQNLPIWPTPPQFSYDLRFKGIQFEDTNNPSKGDVYRAAFLLSSKQGVSNQVNLDYASLLDAKIEFMGTLVDKDGNPLDGTYSVGPEMKLDCDYEQFNQVLQLINQEEDKLFSTTDFVKVNSLIFKIDTLTLSDAWTACSSSANSLLETSTRVFNMSTTICPYKISDPLYSTDPCCNTSSTFFQCCTPRTLPVNVSTFVGLHRDLINNQCMSPDCTSSILDEYYNSLSVVQDCDVTGYVSTNSQLETRNILRECKKLLVLPSCNFDSECGNYKCDLFSRTCMIPPVDIDKIYLQCVFSNLPTRYIFSIIQKYQLPQIESPSFTEALFKEFSMDDCTYITGVAYRTSYNYYSKDVYQGRCYAYNCLDLACETVHDVCYDGNIGGWKTDKLSSVDSCGQIGFCPREYCYDESSQDCIDNCNLVSGFCGYCATNKSDCFWFDQYQDKDSCEQASNACIYPVIDDIRSFDYNIPQEECEDLSLHGTCDKPCGHVCAGVTKKCAIADFIDEATCLANYVNVTYDSYAEMCYYTDISTKLDCDALNPDPSDENYPYTYWMDCGQRVLDECISPFPYGCYIEPVPCKNQKECENQGGQCSDDYFFSSKNIPFYPDKFGKCVRGHYFWKSNWLTPTCNSDTEKDSPMGCFYQDVYQPEGVVTQAKCNDLGQDFSWWSPATSRETCEQHKGCVMLDKSVYNLPYNHRFNEMNESLCNECGADSFRVWKNKFEWTPGKWTPARSVKPQWFDNHQYTYSGKVDRVLDYQRLFDEIDNSVNLHIADLYRSESLCRMERIEENLKSISCSCSGTGGDEECFSASALILGQTKPCATEQTLFKFSYGVLFFNATSVPHACTSTVVYQLSKQLFKSTTPQTLSSNFVSYRKPDNYGILNSKGAVIGTILGDGVRITTQGVNTYTLCFDISQNEESINSKYTVYDFAMEVNDNESENSTIKNILLSPMESVTFFNFNVSGVDPNMLCSNITFDQNVDSYFPIIRVEHWHDQNKEVFDKTATGLIYSLACLFLLTALWGLFQIGVVFFKYHTKVDTFKLVHILIVIETIFITIRCIYFFVIPSGTLQGNAVGDYILVVLPTFMYFTAFTIIISLWYMIVKTKSTGRNLVKRLQMVIFTINVILYLLFIVIVLVFHFSEKEIKSTSCGSRIVIEASNSPPQFVVSIVYAVIQALISLVIGSAFIYLGGSLYLSMRKSKVVETSVTASQQKKIFTVTFACSIGFILHCVFVLILVGAEPSNMVFSFLGLIITEIIPCISIFYCYNQGHFTGLKQSTVPKKLSYVEPNTQVFSKSKRGGGLTDSNFASGGSSINLSSSSSVSRN